MRKNVEYLAENGPTSSTTLDEEDETYNIDPADKMMGVCVFKLTSATKTKVGGMVTPVYYIDGMHSEEAVLREFLAANPNLVNAVSRSSLHRMIGGHGSVWKEAAPEVTAEFYEAPSDPATA